MDHQTGLGSGAVGRKTRQRVFRFAPSPNGFLHLGHAYSALMNRRIAAACDGAVLLRMENIDRDRCTTTFEAAIMEDLAWLGFHWQPPVLRQSERMAAYRSVLAKLDFWGFVYPCFCTRGDIARVTKERSYWPRDPDGSPLYPGTCRHLPDGERRRRIASGEPAARRFDLARARAAFPTDLTWVEFHEGSSAISVSAQPEAWGDALLARKDIGTSYHLAVVTDDAAQGVTDVVRGRDLFDATSLHRLLQQLLGLPAPTYHHHRLIEDEAGSKLAKSTGALSLRAMRAAGASSEDIHGQLGFA